MQWETRKANLKKVSVTLHDLYESKDITLDLFEVDRAKTNQDQNNQLSQTMDKINKRFGSNTVNLGTCPKTNVGYVGTKVAFNRIPELEEFSE
jgi:DNA polymerase-4